MGYIKERMTKVNVYRPINPYDFAADEEVLPYTIVISCAVGGATAIAYTLKEKVRVIDAFAVATASAVGSTVVVQDADGNAITSTMSTATDTLLSRATTIDDDNWDESKAASLIVEKSGTAVGCLVFITVINKV